MLSGLTARLRTLAAAATVIAIIPRAAPAASPPTLAVLYFDNDTGDASFDVFQKGFADMVITDIAGSPGLVVVERDKLQAIIGELKLQHSRYFDEKTALKLGKQLGARYAVTGSFVALKPHIRINARMIDVRTGKIVVATSVTGRSDELFDLEQELVHKFLASLELQATTSAIPKTRASLSAVMDFSEAIDLADEGDLQRATAKLDRLVSKSPSFVLGRVRRSQLIERYRASVQRIAGETRKDRSGLTARTDEYLKNHRFVDLDEQQAQIYLGYRELRSMLIADALATRLLPSKGSQHYWPRKKADRRKALALAQAYVDNELQLLREIKAYRLLARSPTSSIYAHLEKSDQDLLPSVKLSLGPVSEIECIEHLVAFVVLGAQRSASGYRIAPPLGALDARRKKVAIDLLTSSWRSSDRSAKSDQARAYEASRLLLLWADVLFFEGRREDGVAKLQQGMDSYSNYRDRYDRRIQRELGLTYSMEVSDRARYAKALKTCDFMDVIVGIRTVMPDRSRRQGFPGVVETVKEIETACRNTKSAKQIMQRMYTEAALDAGKHSYCKEFNDYIARAVSLGLPTSDASGYRKNYSLCP